MNHGKERVATILALGIAGAINIMTIGVLYDAIFSKGPGLSDNATQVLTTAFGGMIGVLGSYVGFRAGLQQEETMTGLRDHLPDSPDEEPAAEQQQPDTDTGAAEQPAEDAPEPAEEG